MRFRLYVDEVGNSDLSASKDENHRYLSLTGIILEYDYVAQEVFPAVERLKQKFFGYHPDDTPIILHRKELVNRKFPFGALRDPIIGAAFDAEILQLLNFLDYKVITIVIDKQEYQNRYSTWSYDPYHYCLAVMVERYVRWLQQEDAEGDVMAEARGGNDDKRLKDSYEGLYAKGTDYVDAKLFSTHLTSSQLKIKPKSENVSGLQLADLIAHPSFKAILNRNQEKPLPNNFGGNIAQILEESKYLRNSQGEIVDWGTKILP